MPLDLSDAEQREATHVLGEMAASRLFALIHERLEELQATKALTQADVARRLGVSEQLVSRWLREPRNMTVRGAGRLLGALEAHLIFEAERFEDITGHAARNAPAAVAAPQPQVFAAAAATTSTAPRRIGGAQKFEAMARTTG